MDTSMLLIAGFATFFNFLVLKWKFTNNRVADGALDASTLAIILYVTSGSMSGMVIGMIASSLFSVYLLWSPLKLDFMDETNDYKEFDFKKEVI